jgi:hypothetical protein
MKDAGLSRVFFTLGLGLAYLTLNLVAVTQQWPLGFALPSIVSFDLSFDCGDREVRQVIGTMALYHAALVASGLIPLLAVLIVYAKRHRSCPWAERIPLSETLGIEPDTSFGRTVQTIIFIGLVLWPAYGLGHALRKLHAAMAYCVDSQLLTVSGWKHLWPGPPKGCPGRWTVEGLIVYEPFVTPWAIATVGTSVLAATIWTIWLVFKPSRDNPR